MNFTKSLIAVAIAASLLTGSIAVASSTNTGDAGIGSPMAWPERKQLITQVVHKWSAYVKSVRGVEPKVWARSMGATFASADPANFRRAARMTTYEGMIATLLGQKTTDAKVIDSLAKDSSKANFAALASPSSGLVYTKITPCRIIDTRLAGGKLVKKTVYSFEASRPGGDFVSQGGAATDCGIPADPAAVVMNVTVVAPEGNGYLTVFPYNEVMPIASSNNYSTGKYSGNEIIVKQTIGDAADFSMYPNFGMHVVADVVGYFAAPAASALDISIANGVQNQIAAGGEFFATATCPSGYSVTGGGAIASPHSARMTLSESYPTGAGTQWGVSGVNTSGNDIVVHARAICARN